MYFCSVLGNSPAKTNISLHFINWDSDNLNLFVGQKDSQYGCRKNEKRRVEGDKVREME